MRQRLYERGRAKGPSDSTTSEDVRQVRDLTGSTARNPRVIKRLVLLLLIAAAFPVAAAAGRQGGSPVALVTAESANEVIAVSLPSGNVLRRLHLHDPVTIAARTTSPAVVVSPSGTVTILAWRTLRVLAVLHNFRSPQLAAITPTAPSRTSPTPAPATSRRSTLLPTVSSTASSWDATRIISRSHPTERGHGSR